MPTLDRHLRAAAAHLTNSDTPHLDARVLAKHALGLDDAGLILAGERRLAKDKRAAIDALLARRMTGEPVAQIVGEKEFFGLTFAVGPGVLTPRPDSETLIEAAIERRPRARAMQMLDLGTGSGCLLCALLNEFPRAAGIGVDKSEFAVRQARANAAALGFAERAQFYVGDWADALSRPFDLIVANPPYIRDGDRESLGVEIREFESGAALFAGPDGFDAYRAIFKAAPAFLAKDGAMIVEAGDSHAAALAVLARAVFPQAAVEICNDLGARPRAVVVDRFFTKKK
ncbi:MAG: peptide chain release factor N(5)-glutamine methyltransferase [Parvularculaceae bacterium]